MSHIPHRKEKDCLNCGTTVVGPYCHQCGQENVVPKETFFHMVTHFFYDIIHFDSKFFETVKDLLFKPGFLSAEYMRGKRASYLHPIKMYVFTSAIFFLLFFSFFVGENVVTVNTGGLDGNDRLERIEKIEKRLKRDAAGPGNDSTLQAKLLRLAVMKDTSRPVTWADLASVEDDFTVINFSGRAQKYKSVDEYDSLQQQLAKPLRDGWFMKRLIRKELALSSKYRNDPNAAFTKLGDTVLHRLPYMLFISLPLFAFILRLLYIRRKQFFYADHAVFTLHLYIFSFILLLSVFGLNKLKDITGWGIIGYVMAALFIWLNVYLFVAMRRFYKQGKRKTFFKFLFTALLSLVMMIILFTGFLFFSAIEL